MAGKSPKKATPKAKKSTRDLTSLSAKKAAQVKGGQQASSAGIHFKYD